MISLKQHRGIGSKKVAQLPPLWATLLAPDPEDPASTTLELDELWSFVLKKANDSWMRDCLVPKEPIGWSMRLGTGACQTCQRLWEAIPEGYRQEHCFTNFWAAYAAVIPQEQHTAVSKATGETAHVERWNNTLRQRLARFVRMTRKSSKQS